MDWAVDANGVPDRGPSVFVVTTGTLCLATVFVAARMWCRIGLVRRFSSDDYAIVVAWLFAFGIGFAINWATGRGLGRHDEHIPGEHRSSLRRAEYVFTILYNPALMATKTSILIFFLRLSRNTKPLMRLASYAVLGIVNVAGTILTIMNIFQCQPIFTGYEDVPFDPKCIPLLTEFLCSAPVNILTDLAILALPMPVLTSMRLPRRQKTILVFTFALGIFVTVVDVVRVYYLQQAIALNPNGGTTAANNEFGGSPQFAWNASLSLMWSAVEVNIGIACACIPTLKPLAMRFMPAMLVDPDATPSRSGSHLTPERGSAAQATAAKAPPAGAGGGLQAPPPSFFQNGGAAPGSDLDGGFNRKVPGGDGSTGNRNYEELMALDFLTTPDMLLTTGSPNALQQAALRRMHQQQRASTAMGSLNAGVNNSGAGPDRSVYFGFVNIRRPKSVLRTSKADSWKYCTLVTILFVMWGFSYGLLNTLNNVVAQVADMTVAQTLGLTSMYFGGGYFLGPLVVGVWILRHDEHHRSRHGGGKLSAHDPIGGFKATFMLGLCIFGTGTIMFWPAAVLASYPGFMICNFVVGFGLAVLETAANPFLTLCGPPAYAEMRLCLAQGIQAVGSVLSGLLAQNVYFSTLESGSSNGGSSSTGRGAGDTVARNSKVLINVQWTYLSVTLLCVALALFFYYIPLPEVRDEELEDAAKQLPVDPGKRNVGGLELSTVCLALAVVAQWTYVAAQECMSIYFRNLLTAALPIPPETSAGPASGPLVNGGPRNDTASLSGTGQRPSLVPRVMGLGPPSIVRRDQPAGMALSVSHYLVIAHTAFAAARFGAGYLAYLSVKHARNRFVPTPRTVLTASISTLIVLAVVVITIRPYHNPNLLSIPIILFFLAEGPGWPLIFSLGLRGQGKRTKLAAAWLTMGASGPAFFPFVIYAIVTRGGSIQTAFSLVVALLCFTLAYPLYLTFVRDARALVDPPMAVEEAVDGAPLDTTLSVPPDSGLGVSLTAEGREEVGGYLDLNEILAARRKSHAGRRFSFSTATTAKNPGGEGDSGFSEKTRGRGRMGSVGGETNPSRPMTTATATTAAASPVIGHRGDAPQTRSRPGDDDEILPVREERSETRS